MKEKLNTEIKELMDVETFIAKELEKELEIFDRHIARYERMPLSERKEQAKKSLIQSGILNKDGSAKETIIIR